MRKHKPKERGLRIRSRPCIVAPNPGATRNPSMRPQRGEPQLAQTWTIVTEFCNRDYEGRML